MYRFLKRSSRMVLYTVLVLGVCVSIANAENTREGITLELGLGVGLSENFHAEEATRLRGVMPVSLGLGGFINPHVAVLLRYSQHNNTIDTVDEGDDVRGNHLFGLQLQYWFDKDYFIAGGPSFMYQNFYRERDDGIGAALSLKAAVLPLLSTQRHSLRISLELTGALSPGQVFTTQALIFEWQYF